MSNQQISQIIEWVVTVLAIFGPLFLIWLDPKGVRKELGIGRNGRKS